jgi:CBS domain-containing membrane protein
MREVLVVRVLDEPGALGQVALVMAKAGMLSRRPLASVGQRAPRCPHVAPALMGRLARQALGTPVNSKPPPAVARGTCVAPFERAERGEEDAMRVQDVMSQNPVTVSPETNVADVWDLMREHSIRHIPVLDRGALVGMLSDRDLAHFDMARLLNLEGADALRRALATPVAKVMSTDVVDVTPDAELGDVIDLLVENRIGAVPVVRPESQELVGIVSYIDVLEAIRDVLDAE